MSITYREVMKWTDEQCREFLIAQRWPDGVTCPKCGAEKPYTITRKTKSKNVNKSLYKCRGCKKQFTVTTGTIFEDSHAPLSIWFAVIYEMCADKKGVSALEIQRKFGVHYKTAWFMCHRIREAMREDGFLLSGTIEADETFIGGRNRRGHPVAKWEREKLDREARGEPEPKRQMGPRRGETHPRIKKATVFGMIERGGRVRSFHVPDNTAKSLRPLMITNIDVKNSRLITDGHRAYREMKIEIQHDAVNHDVEYVRYDNPYIHTQGIENYWSLVKRGILGTWHHVGVPYLDQYLKEFDYRFNRRKISDEQRFAALFRQVAGKRLTWYCQTPQPENPYA